MIDIIFAPPRTGKTCLMTHLLNMGMYDRQRNRAMQNEILLKRLNGFDTLTVPQHCVSANYDIFGRKFRYSRRYSRRINPYRLGFANPYVDVHFNLPYELIGITEAQKYLNSRMSKYFPDWQSRWYEQHGHNNLDIYLDTQRPMLIDVNIRELSSFTEIMSLDVKYDDFGQARRLTWIVRQIPNSSLFEKYMSSGKQDKSCFTEQKIIADYNVFDCYDSQSCKPKFYDGHIGQDFDYEQAEETDETIDGYIRYLKEFDDELPDGYYKTKVA